jgi:hypothetical protein
MSADLTPGANQGREIDQEVDLPANLTSRAAPGTMLRVDETPPYSQQSRLNCQLSLFRPLLHSSKTKPSNYQHRFQPPRSLI